MTWIMLNENNMSKYVWVEVVNLICNESCFVDTTNKENPLSYGMIKNP